ncbi:MAG: TauD/TfdA family dioxygenase [Alphaproteobacteria bacterium]|nr:TauD/TfdA family dioxygenase [Alphaproteobacteria bacterium]
MAGSTRWIRHLTEAHIAEIDGALQDVKRRDIAWSAVNKINFPLPGLKPLFDDISDELENGSGMMQLRGLPVARYAEEDLRRIWYGIGANLGSPLNQNKSGEQMRAIRDEGGSALAGQRYGQIDEGQGKTFLSSYARTLTNGQLRFHTDRCDAVGLLCVRQAKAGGVSKLASSAMVHNTMLERAPELCAALYEDIWRSRFGEEPGGEKLAYPLPIFGQRDGRFTSHWSLTYVEAAQKMGEVPRLTEKQKAGIDMLMALAQELSFEMRFAPGDMQLLNNHVIYHGRTPFEDDASSGQDRLLLRIWLAMPNSRALPKGHEVLWRSIEPGANRGGIGQVAA